MNVNTKSNNSFSPWVFVTYNCSCRCEYCMIPEMKCNDKNISSDTFNKMMIVCEELIKNKTFDNIHLKLSGGEPFLVFDRYKDIVTEYRQKYPGQMTFGVLTNFTKFNDEIADWMELNNIGMQISLDDIENGKPLANGKSSSFTVLDNIQKLMSRKIGFSFNTVLDIERTKDLTKLANYVSKFKNMDWGLNASYTENDPTKVNEVIKIFDDCLFQLVKNGFDIYNNLRFYNTVVGKNRGGCGAGVNSCAIGTELEVWSCQSLCDKEKLGIFDENIKNTLLTSHDNSYFRDRRMMSECSDCPVLGVCRGGCRATHENKEINDVVCQIRKNILGKIMTGYYYPNQNNNYNHNTSGIDNIINDYIKETETIEVETPSLG